LKTRCCSWFLAHSFPGYFPSPWQETFP
jgi:hypothetical protein